MGRARSELRNRTEAFGVALFARLLRGSPEGAEAFGRRLGRLYRLLDGRRRRLAEANVAFAFPEKTPGEVGAFVKDVFAHFGGVAGEMLHAASRPAAETLRRIEVKNAEAACAASATGRGVVFLTAHLGSWEWAALGTSGVGVPVHVIARPLDNPLLDEKLTELRTATGNAVIPRRDAAREMLRTLRQGGALGILMDQHARPPDGIPVPFFGRPAATTSALARIVDRTEALVVPAAALRVAPARWQLTYHEVLDVRTLPPAERAVEALTARFNRIVESLIRLAPEQWLWLHNRWRSD
jgi:KDO2-lipid IV(A) lauroyltransferase